MIPIVAIVMGIGSGMLKMWTSHEQEMARIRATTHVAHDPAVKNDLETLRLEIASLRDTTTQYDMSVERALQELKRRMDQIEARRPSQYAATPSATEEQIAGIEARS